MLKKFLAFFKHKGKPTKPKYEFLWQDPEWRKIHDNDEMPRSFQNSDGSWYWID